MLVKQREFVMSAVRHNTDFNIFIFLRLRYRNAMLKLNLYY